MKKHSTLLLEKAVRVVLSVALGLSLVTGSSLHYMSASALDSSIETIADPNTMDSWKAQFGTDADQLTDHIITSANAGYVWGDKSVFEGDKILPEEFINEGVGIKDKHHFLVAMSALAANKEIVGYSAIPTDTVLVLDLSNSMSETALNNMITATNDAIVKLLSLNRNNRVGVVVYQGTTQRVLVEDNPGDRNDRYETKYTKDASVEVLLDIDRYTGVNRRVNQTTQELFIQYSNDSFSVINGVKNSHDENVSASKYAGGATYIQGGLWETYELFDAVEDTVINSGVQEGTKRMPVMVLMSDGAPTLATKDFNQVNDPERGNGTAVSATDENAFLTSLTAAWVKEKMEEHYDRSGLLYTLGLGVDNDGVARSVLDPENASQPIKNYWNTYLDEDVQDGANIQIGRGNSRVSIEKDAMIESMQYVNEYFSASDATGLINAFNEIVETIILQSKYYPTLIEDGENEFSGYITFTDELGEYMEVKDIKGILAGTGEDRALYSGLAMAQAIFTQNTFGNISDGNMNNLNENGQLLIDAISTRLGCSEDIAKTLLKDAITSDQLSLSYDDNNQPIFSNYISWYANEEGKFISSWDGHGYEDANDATYAVKSYGFLGNVGSEENYDASNMMYIMVQVRHDIAKGTQTVTFAIPASLIPMVTYNISFDGKDFDDASNIKMDVDVNEPIRLVYEAGLRSDINELNVKDKVDSDYVHVKNGVYSFYTNMYAHDDNGNALSPDDVDPQNHDTTWLDFEPSLENERFYYTSDQLLLEKSGDDYLPVTQVNEGQTYYHEFIAFNVTEGDNVELVRYYPEVSQDALNIAKNSVNEEGYLYIPKGTVYSYVATDDLVKKENSTQTLRYYFNPTMTLPDGSSKYHADAYLGNNGKLTLTPATGIVLSKTLDAGVPTTDEVFTFHIRSLSLPSTYTLVHVNRAGEETIEERVVTGGSISVDLLSGEKAYIVGLPARMTYSIIEMNEEDYTVKSINGNNVTSVTGVSELYTLNTYDFVNTLKVKGNLAITKDVSYPEGFDGSQDPHVFDIYVYLPQHVNQTLKLTNGKEIKIDSTGKSEVIQLKNKETVVITGLTQGDEYRVIEENIPSGYTLKSSQDDLTGTIPEGTESVVVVNEYDYDPVGTSENPSHISLELNKTVTSEALKDWSEDPFDFILQYYGRNGWQDINAQSKSLTIDESTSDSSQVTKKVVYDDLFDVVNHDLVTANSPETFVFSEPGVYRYRIIEKNRGQLIDGISYDANENPFTIYVTDLNFDGKLEISNVTYYDPMTLTISGDEDKSYALSAHFENEYNVLGTASVEIDILKEFVNNTGIEVDLSGYVFELVDVTGQVVATSPPTTTSGRTTIHMAYSLNDENMKDVYTYTLREVKPGDSAYDNVNRPGVQFSAQDIENIKVYISHNGEGNATASFSQSEIQVTYSALFKNTYSLKSAEATIEGTKTLNGRDMESGEFTFELYETDASFNIENKTAIDTEKNTAAKNNTASSFAFDTLTYTQAGTYYYVVKEVKGNLAGVKYDEDIYQVTVNVGLDSENPDSLKASVVTVGLGDNIDGDTIAFENTFVPLPMTSPVVIEGGKLLNETAAIEAGKFTFNLYETDESFEINGNPIQTTNDAYGRFAFNPIVYTEAQLGNHYYVVTEEDLNQTGYTYDQRQYLITVNVRVDLDENSDTQYRIVAEVTEIKVKVGNTLTDIDTIEFKNTYKPDAVDVVLEGTKVFTGDTHLYSEDFTFYLYHATERYEIEGVAVDSASINHGTFSFDTMTYESIGPRYYVVKEEAYTLVEGMTYDSTVYQVKVDVVDVNGKLEATVTVINSANNKIVFTNDYDRPLTPVSLSFTGVKTLLGRDMSQGEFTFKLHRTNENFEHNESEALRVTTNTSLGEESPFTFDPIYYDREGTYYYTISEDSSENTQGITYDPTLYHVTVEVKADANKQLYTVVTYETNNKKVDEVTFENAYHDASLEIIKTQVINGVEAEALKEVKAGDQVTYVLKVINNGLGEASNVVISDAVPAGLLDVTVNDGGVLEDGVISWTIDELASQEEVTVSFSAIVPEVKEDTRWENIASVTYTNGDGDEEEDESEKVIIEVNLDTDIDVIKLQSVNGQTATSDHFTVKKDDKVTYYITVTNGDEAEEAENVVVTDKIPEGLVLVEGSISNDGVLENGIITWNLGNLEAGESITVEFSVTVPEVKQTTVWENTAKVEHDNDPDEEDDPSNTVTIEEEYTPVKVDTGDHTSITSLVLLALSSFISFVILFKKKEDQAF